MGDFTIIHLTLTANNTGYFYTNTIMYVLRTILCFFNGNIRNLLGILEGEGSAIKTTNIEGGVPRVKTTNTEGGVPRVKTTNTEGGVPRGARDDKGKEGLSKRPTLKEGSLALLGMTRGNYFYIKTHRSVL